MTLVRLKTPTSYYGGKQKMLSTLLPLIPPHHLYCEPFIGGGALFWAKEPAPIEVINDRLGYVATFYKVLQSDFEALAEMVNRTLHSQQEHADSVVILNNPHLFSDVHVAWAFWVGCNQSYASQPGDGWAFQRKGGNRCANKLVNARANFGDPYRQRLAGVTVECGDALKIIRRFDSPESFFYLDPPYPGTDCGHYEGYTWDDFRQLLTALERIEGKFLLSNYPSDLLSDYVAKNGLYYRQVEKAMCVTKGKTKIEALVANYPI